MTRPRSRAPSALLVGGLFLLASLGSWVAEAADPCRQARKSFRKGVRAYDRQNWEAVVGPMLEALGSGCEEPIRIVIPYGRWVYRYTPGLYLAVAMSQCPSCLASRPPGKPLCQVPVEWWADLQGRGQDVLLECSGCSPATSAAGVRCSLAVDWWQKLQATRGEVPSLMHTYRATGCDGIVSPLPLFRKVLLGRDDDPYIEACAAILTRLRELLVSCDVQLPSEVADDYVCPAAN